MSVDLRRIVVTHNHDQPVHPGAVLHENGPRIGHRRWRVVSAEPARRYLHCWCQPMAEDEPHDFDDEHWHLRR